MEVLTTILEEIDTMFIQTRSYSVTSIQSHIKVMTTTSIIRRDTAEDSTGKID